MGKCDYVCRVNDEFEDFIGVGSEREIELKWLLSDSPSVTVC